MLSGRFLRRLSHSRSRSRSREGRWRGQSHSYLASDADEDYDHRSHLNAHGRFEEDEAERYYRRHNRRHIDQNDEGFDQNPHEWDDTHQNPSEMAESHHRTQSPPPTNTSNSHSNSHSKRHRHTN